MIQITQEEKLSAKTRIKLARATGLLIGAKAGLSLGNFDKQDCEIVINNMIKIIDEVLELLK